MNTEFIGKDQNWQEESTIYWVQLTGTDNGTGITFSESNFGICESGPESWVLDCDGNPMTEGDHETIAVLNHVKITDEMRSE